MARMRNLLTVLLAIALLPWGALVHAAQTAPKEPPRVGIENPLPARAAVLPLRCRTATLTSNVCRLDFAPEDEGDETLLPRSEPVDGEDEGLVPADWAGPVPVPPPKMN